MPRPSPNADRAASDATLRDASLRVVVVDDEANARALLHELLDEWPDVEVVGEADSVAAAVRIIGATSPDVVFLDVQLPDGDGFTVLDALPAVTASGTALPAVVFVTAHDDHAVRAFEHAAIDYVLKPFDDQRLAESLARARERHGLARDREDLRRLIALLRRTGAAPPSPAPAPPARLAVRERGRVTFVATDDVTWIQGDGNRVRIRTASQLFETRDSLGNLERQLDAGRFVRVHRSAIVNAACIREVQPWFHGEYVLVLHDGTKLTTGRAYRDNVHRLIGKG